MRFIIMLIFLVVIAITTKNKSEAKKFWGQIVILVIGFIFVQILLANL